jgi:MFS family permease
MLCLALLPSGIAVGMIFIFVAIHRLGAGFCLAALHIYALSSVPKSESATAAGIYSMNRFAGSLFGAALGGIIIEAGISRHGITMEAYSPAFLFFFFVSLVGAISAAGLSRKLPEAAGTVR